MPNHSSAFLLNCTTDLRAASRRRVEQYSLHRSGLGNDRRPDRVYPVLHGYAEILKGLRDIISIYMYYVFVVDEICIERGWHSIMVGQWLSLPPP